MLVSFNIYLLLCSLLAYHCYTYTGSIDNSHSVLLDNVHMQTGGHVGVHILYLVRMHTQTHTLDWRVHTDVYASRVYMCVCVCVRVCVRVYMCVCGVYVCVRSYLKPSEHEMELCIYVYCIVNTTIFTESPSKLCLKFGLAYSSI